MKRHLTRLFILLGCIFLLTGMVFAESQNTDDDKADKDGSYTFANETEKYGYRSYLVYDRYDSDNYVGARLYDITIPEEGKLIAEISNSQIKHMKIEINSHELKKDVCEYAFDSGSGKVESMPLPKGEYTVIFGYKWQDNSIIPYDEDAGKKYFDHYISWKKEPYIRGNSISLSQTDVALEVSDYIYLNATVSPAEAYYKDVTWSSSDTSVAEVDSWGGVKAVAAGTAVIKATTKDGVSGSCTVTVKSKEPEKAESTYTDAEVSEQTTAIVRTGTVKVISTDSHTVAFTKAKNTKSVTVPNTVTIGGVSYKVTSVKANAFNGSKIRTVTIGKNVKKINANAFKGSRATKLILKTRLLKKASVKSSLKGSKIKTVQVKVGTKKVNKIYVKKYKKIFTKANSGKKVTVK